MNDEYDDDIFDAAFTKFRDSQKPMSADPQGWNKFQDTVEKSRRDYSDYEDDYDNDWKQWSEPEDEPATIINATPFDPYLIDNHEKAALLGDDTLVVDADGYAFQRRNGEWFMTGSAYGSTEFSGTFPARIAILTKAIEKDDD